MDHRDSSRVWSAALGRFFFHPIGGVLGVLVGLLVVTHPLAATPIIA